VHQTQLHSRLRIYSLLFDDNYLGRLTTTMLAG
jgi:hypothetical protein